MNVLNNRIEKKIQNDIIKVVLQEEYDSALKNIGETLDELYANIPGNKRISYGKVYTIKVLAEYLYTHFAGMDAPINVYEIASNIFNKSEDFRSKGVSLGMLSFYGLGNYKKVLPFFESAAAY